MLKKYIIQKNSEDSIILTAFTAGGSNEADMATPTNEPALPPNTDKATPIPEAKAISKPGTRPRKTPLKNKLNNLFPQSGQGNPLIPWVKLNKVYTCLISQNSFSWQLSKCSPNIFSWQLSKFSPNICSWLLSK